MDSIATAQATRPARPPTGRYDRFFFFSVILIALIIVVVGFGPTYYFAGLLRAPLPSAMIQVHGAFFSAWMLLLVVQTGLISAGRVALHRRLGLAGFVLTGLVFVSGLLAVASQLHFRAGFGTRALALSAVNFSLTLTFGLLMALAYAARNRSIADHKRLVLLAIAPLVVAALDRWPVRYLYHNVGHDFVASYLLLLLILGYDLWSSHQIHRSTLWGSLFVVLMTQAASPIGSTAVWQSLARGVQSANLSRSFGL